MKNNLAIQVTNLSKVYKLYEKKTDRLKEALSPFRRKYHHDFYALKNINLEVKKREILGIVGKNGAGKSTLLEMISGISTPTSGFVKVSGNVSVLLALGVGFNPEMTGIENIYFSGTLKGFSKEEMDKRLYKILDFADIGLFANQTVNTYSSGMKARLGFAVAVQMDPEILIVDEILAVGDELFRRKCYAKMEELFKGGCTVLYVSHSVNSINQICTRVIFLDRGELILDGKPKLVTTHYQRFLYSTPENKEKIRNEIKRLNKDAEKKMEFPGNIEINQHEFRANNFERKKENEEPEPEQEAFFIKNFVSRSTVEYKNYDVEMIDINIKTLDSRIVNSLVIDEEYIFTYKLKFNTHADNAQVLIAFKTEKGFFVSGGKADEKKNCLTNVREGDEFLVEWHFRNNLLAGNYYINVAIKTLKDGEEIFLNRIVDAMVFKVQKKQNWDLKGVLFLNQHPRITPLDTATQ